MVQNLRKLFRKWGKASPVASSSSSSFSSSSLRISSTSNQRHAGHASPSPDQNQNKSHESDESLHSPPSSSTMSSSSSSFPDARSALKWAPMLAKIPKLAQQLVNMEPNDHEGVAHLVHNLVDLLSQMAGKDSQKQILRFYQVYHDRSSQSARVFANPSHGFTPVSVSRARPWNHKGLFLQCVHSLLSCWKFALLQLNTTLHPSTTSSSLSEQDTTSTSSPIPDEMVELYHKLILLIAERVEFSLRNDERAEGSRRTSVSIAEDSSSDSKEDDLYYYRCLLVGTVRYVVESVQKTQRIASSTAATPSTSNSSKSQSGAGLHRVRRKKRTLLEMRFDARVLAICFVRVPIIQKAILNQILAAYRAKKWTKPPKPSSSDTSTKATNGLTRSVSCGNNVHRATVPSHGRKSTNATATRRVWHGSTFAESLQPWSQYDGHILTGVDDPQPTAIKVHSWTQGHSNDSPCNSGRSVARADSGSSSFSSPSRSSSASSTSYVEPPLPQPSSSVDSHDASRTAEAQAAQFEMLNPTLFKWTRFSPYLGTYRDTEVFSFLQSTSNGTPPCSPGSSSSYVWSPSLPLVFERLVCDAEFFMFFISAFYCHVEKAASTSQIVWNALPGYSLLVRTTLYVVREAAWKQWRDLLEYVDPMASIDETECFGLTKRGVKTVLSEAAHVLKHAELLESCVLASFECTNVYDPRSVGLCLGQLEQWFVAVAVHDVRHESFRLPSCFKGRAFAIGLRILLSSVSFEILNRVLLFLYNQMELFDGELRHSVLKALVQRHFFLFLHWNADVRNQYHHLLVFRISRIDRFALHSFVDSVLVGHHAQQFINSVDDASFNDSGNGQIHHSKIHNNNNNHDLHDLDDYDSDEDRAPSSRYEKGVVPMEQALWRAFDACTASICVEERNQAREASRKFQSEQDAAQNRAIAFRHLSKQATNEDLTKDNVNEVLPGARPSHVVELLELELRREPPYYLRYLPPEEVALLEGLQSLAQSISHPTELQVYASHALRNYADLLKRYYAEIRDIGFVQPPPLGFY